MIPKQIAKDRVQRIRNAVAGPRRPGQKKVCLKLCDQILGELEAYGEYGPPRCMSQLGLVSGLGEMYKPKFFGGNEPLCTPIKKTPNKVPWWKLWRKESGL